MKDVLILEDHQATILRLREIVSETFDHINVTVVDNVEKANVSVKSHTFDLALIDINLPDGNGIEFLAAMKKQQPQCLFVISTMFDDDDHVFSALSVGANGYLLKDQTDEQISHLLKGILEGSPPLSPAISRKILEHFTTTPAVDDEAKLSNRENEVLTYIAKGLTRKEVANYMDLSVNTVSAYIKSIYKKLSINSSSEATIEAIRRGLIKV